MNNRPTILVKRLSTQYASQVCNKAVTNSVSLFLPAPIYRALQTIVLKSPQTSILHFSRYLVLSGLLGQRHMFNTVRLHLSRPHIAKDIFELVGSCVKCLRVQWSRRHLQHLKLFTAICPLCFVTVGILGPLPKTLNENQFIIFLINRYVSLTHTVLVSKVTATQAALK